MRRYCWCLFAICALGCGGGGGGNSGVTTAVTPATTVRRPTPGDSWTYNISGHTPAGNFDGQLVSSQSGEIFNGLSSVRDTESVTITSGASAGNIGISNQWYVLDPTQTHTIGIQQVGGVPLTVTSTTYNSPITITSNTSLSGQTTLSSGLVIDTTAAVIGAERVTVPAGTFDCWKISRTEVDSDGSRSTSTGWLPVQYGSVIKQIVNGSNTSGNYSFTQVLT